MIVALFILALVVGFYFYVAHDLAELIEHERMLDELWDDEA